MRYFLEFAYKGTRYHGWQYQPNACSVQETINHALSTSLRENIDVLGAGRTDAGVHAKQMFAHFDTEKEIVEPVFIKKLNSFLPKDIAVFKIHKVAVDAHARFDANARTYEYYIHQQKNAFECDDSWFFPYPLHLELMNSACAILMKYTDFECFSKTNTDVNTFNCTITKAFWIKKEEQLVFTISADRFLRNMVRAIVGTMINIGQEKVSLQQFRAIIESKNRSKAGFSVPAHGLYLTQVTYPYITNLNTQKNES